LSAHDFENLVLAREMGYTGVALKACKMQSQEMLMASAGMKYKMFLCVQDLTCPGASLIQSASPLDSGSPLVRRSKLGGEPEMT
jgi:hypothetical protein